MNGSSPKPRPISRTLFGSAISWWRKADAFLDTLVFDENGSVQDLLTADFTMVNDQLAQCYNLAVQGKSGFYRAQRDEGIGPLTLGAFLASRSKSDSSSPTQRDLALYERLLCNEPPPPPEGEIPEIKPPEPGVHTTRERYEILHAQEPCSTCHIVFDPLGFAFEHFDEGGRYRADEFGLPIEAHGVAYDGARELFTFSDQADQAQKMADEPVVLDCISDQLAAYAFGGVAECLAEEGARDAFNAGDLSIREFMAELAASPHFRERKSE